MNRGATAEISLGAISHNLGLVRAVSRCPRVIAVVKADAYGHGAVEVARRLSSEGVDMLAVAFSDEARQLRESGITAPILVLFDTDTEDVFTYGLTPVVSCLPHARALSRAAEKRNCRIRVHLKVDTGMGRLGLAGRTEHDILEISLLKGIEIEGLLSHFPDADCADTAPVREQVSRFQALRDRFAACGLSIPVVHMANSPAVLAIPGSHFTAVRPGLMLYGYSSVRQADGTAPACRNEQDRSLVPAMRVTTRLLAVRRLPAGSSISYGRTFVTARDSLIGVIAIGYADGFSRQFSSNGEVLIRGRRWPVAGRVCMDLTMVDLTGISDVEERDEVVIMGRQGGEEIDAEELARRIGTIPYEILTSLGSRARRVHTG